MPRKGTYARLYKRPIISSACLMCGSPVTGTKAKRYCSTACRMKAWRLKHSVSLD